MRKLIPLLVICLAVLCFFTSCGELEKSFMVGTWSYDQPGEWGNYITYRVVYSGQQIQIIKTRYMDSSRRYSRETAATEPMNCTVGPNGVVSVSRSVGVMNKIDFTDTFSLDESQNKLVWDWGYSKWEYVLNKKSEEVSFVTPALGYEQYTVKNVEYWEPGESISIEDSNIFLYSDGHYSWEGDGRTVSTGSWEKSATEPNKLSLIASDSWVFSRIDFEYVTDSPEASHLKTLNIVSDNEEFDFADVSYDLSWYVEPYR